MRQTSTIFFLFCIIVLLYACGGSKQKEAPTVELDLSDATLQEIYKFQDKRDITGLKAYIAPSNPPTYRYAAALAYGSVQDVGAIDEMASLLYDESEQVRAAAAFAVGQLNSPLAVKHLQKAFKTDSTSFFVKGRILEAIGKSANKKFLIYLSTTKSYKITDTLLIEGQASGIYNFALRSITDTSGTKKMVSFLENPKCPQSVRLIAAHYLSRAKRIDLNPYTSRLITVLGAEKDIDVRMALVLAFGKIDNERITPTLTAQYAKEKDYRIKTNILQALSGSSYAAVKPIALQAMNDGNLQLAMASAKYFIANGKSADVDYYYSVARDTTRAWQTQIKMAGAALKNISYTRASLRKKISEGLKARFAATTNVYEKGLILEALSGFTANHQFIKSEIFKPNAPAVVKTYGIEALVEMRKNPKLAVIWGVDFLLILKFYKNTFKEAIESGDVAMIGIAASALREKRLNYKNMYASDYSFLKTAQDKLSRPREIETYIELQKTIDYFNDTTTKITPEKYNHPINWTALEGIGSSSRAIIKTAKGEIQLRFYPFQAPGSVSNFIKLAEDGFYDGKTFHRIVPNFVAQGGCPRGDGWGSPDYSLRSELSPLKYNTEGWVGMASAGKDTEGTQWFITYSPTPHLDGKYTIFARVTKGMDVAHQLAIGDKIESITIQKTKAAVTVDK